MAESATVLNLHHSYVGTLANNSPGTFSAFCSLVAQHANLQSFDLSKNHLDWLSAEQWQELGIAVQNLNLTSLNFGFNSFGALANDNLDTFSAFCSFLAQCTKLQSLNLSRSCLDLLSAEQWQKLCDTLSRLTNLREIIHDLDKDSERGQQLNAITAEQLLPSSSVEGNLKGHPSLMFLAARYIMYKPNLFPSSSLTNSLTEKLPSELANPILNARAAKGVEPKGP